MPDTVVRHQPSDRREMRARLLQPTREREEQAAIAEMWANEFGRAAA